MPYPVPDSTILYCRTLPPPYRLPVFTLPANVWGLVLRFLSGLPIARCFRRSAAPGFACTCKQNHRTFYTISCLLYSLFSSCFPIRFAVLHSTYLLYTYNITGWFSLFSCSTRPTPILDHTPLYSYYRSIAVHTRFLYH